MAVYTLEEFLKRKKMGTGIDDTVKLEDYVKSRGIKRTTSDDIAPVRTDKWYDGYFKKSEGGVSEAVIGSSMDVLKNATESIVGLGEKVVDTFAYVAPYTYASSKLQNGGILTEEDHDFMNSAKKDAAEFIKKDLYDEEEVAKNILAGFGAGQYMSNIAQSGGMATLEDWEKAKTISEDTKKYLDEDMEKNSVFDEKADALVQSAGQLLGTAGFQAMGVPWWITTGLTTFGAETENALNQDANYGEAGMSGLISAGAEILTEKISGGISFGGKTLDDGLTRVLANNISNKTVRTLAKLGIDAVGEGGEEILSGLMSAIGQKLTYADEKELNELFSKEDVWDSFIGGLLLGGGAGAINVVKSAKNGTDYATGLSKNEEAVVEKEIENRIKEAEADGKKLERKDKSQIREQVLNDIEKGYLNLDTIESVLGGKTYESYKSITDKENALKKEIGSLQNDARPAMQKRLSEAKAELSELMNKSEKTKLKDQLSSEVQELVKDSKLAESYNEKARKGQAFEADLTQYDAKYQDTIKRAVESGILNNTNRTREFVDLIAKLSADKGVSFDFTNNEALKNSGFAIEGKTINGLVQNNNVLLNVDSAKALNTVVGHEITHVLEGTDLYTELQTLITEYANSKGDYESRFESAKELYKNVYTGLSDADYDAKVAKEVVADLVGDYLFTDSDFINNLSATKPNIFKKIYNEIKYMCKMATSGSAEEKKLLEIKKAFEKAYQEGGKAEGDTKYNISKDADGNLFVDINEDILDAQSGESVARIIQKVLSERFNNLIEVNGQKFQANKTTNDEFRRSNSANALMNNPNQAYNDKLRTIANADEILATAKNWIGEKVKHTRKDDIVEFARGNVTYRVNGNGYVADVIVATRKNGSAVLYDLVNIYEKNIADAPVTMASSDNSQRRQDMSAIDKLTQNSENVKYSLSEDANGNKLSEKQIEYFKDSKIRDGNGNLKVMYHGSPASFTIFDKKKAKSSGYYGRGFYFTESESHASQYGNRYEVYLNIKNPMREGTNDITKEQLRKFVEAVAENEDYGIENYGYGATIDSVTDSVFGKDDFAMIMDINATSIGDMVEAIQLFNEVNGTDYDGIVVPTETVAFYPEQINAITNQNPTDNPDINMSLGDQMAPIGSHNVYGRDIALETALAPIQETTGTETDIAPVKEMTSEGIQNQDVAPIGEKETGTTKSDEQQRKWVGTSTGSEAVDGKVLVEDLDQDLIHYQPISNKKTLGNANAMLGRMGYSDAVTYFNGRFVNKNVGLDDIALGERLIQEAVKSGDYKTAGELIQNVSILGTELGQKVQALSIIKRLTPEGQLKMLQKTVERGKSKGDKAFDGVVITQEMIDHILKTYGKDGSYKQEDLNKAVEDVKQQIADQMKVTTWDKMNAWRYLSMLGNPKTHIRNLVSNVAMKGTLEAKNAVARTIETIAPIENRTKTWIPATKEVKTFAKQTTSEMKDVITGDSKYSTDATIKQKRQIFKNKILNSVYEFNSDMLGKEDWWFSKPAFTNALSEYLTANGIKTEQDIANNAELVEKAKNYAIEQSQIATFRQYSWLANKINEIEKHNKATEVAVGAILPFKKTPVNVAKAGLNYSPLGFAKTLTYDVAQVKNGNMEASELVDHLAQNVTGSALALAGYMLAMSGFLNGAGDDDKEGSYDYQLGKQSYSVNIGGSTYSLSWLSPVAMPLFVGANAYEQLVEGKEWNGDVVVETLAQTLDPLSEMSFLSSLDDVLSSYDSGIEKFTGIGKSMAQNYVTQFVPTLSSQIATVMDDKKRSTKVAGDSDFKFVDETINKLKYKIPLLRETLEPSTDIWGNEIKQTENVVQRAFETFLAPYSKRDNVASEIDGEIKELYAETGDNGLIPNVPYNYVNYEGEKYKMSGKEYTDFKKTYGQTANDLLEELFNSTTYQGATTEERVDMVNDVYDYARDEAKREYLEKEGIEFTNATKDGVEYYKENPIKGAIENDMSLDEFDLFSNHYADYVVSKAVGGYDAYKSYTSGLNDIKADKDENGNAISGSAKEKKTAYINSLDLDYGQKIILYRSLYDSKADKQAYNADIVEYLNNRDDISYEEMVAILESLDMKVNSDGTVSW